MAEHLYYETERALGEYLMLHYGEGSAVLPYAFGPAEALDFPARCVTECLDAARVPADGRALDLGCAVGRSSFELARVCGQVIGVDYSHAFIAAAQRLRREGSLAFNYLEEGGLVLDAVARVPAGIDRGRVAFEQGDAQAPRPGLGLFDVVVLANLIDHGRPIHFIPSRLSLAQEGPCVSGLFKVRVSVANDSGASVVLQGNAPALQKGLTFAAGETKTIEIDHLGILIGVGPGIGQHHVEIQHRAVG